MILEEAFVFVYLLTAGTSGLKYRQQSMRPGGSFICVQLGDVGFQLVATNELSLKSYDHIHPNGIVSVRYSA